MGASYPKPDGQKVNRVEPRFGWVDLPAGRAGDPPVLPEWRLWHASTVSWWAELWAKPQATMWEPSGSTLWTLACLYDDLIAGRSDASRVSAEMRQHEDRHGLSPKAMLQLRWRLVGEGSAARVPARSSTARRKRLRVV